MAVPGPTKSMTVVAKSTGSAVHGCCSFFLSLAFVLHHYHHHHHHHPTLVCSLELSTPLGRALLSLPVSLLNFLPETR
jgi:hypothetical protein